MKSQGAAKNEANNVAQAKTVSEKPVEKIDFSKVEIEPLFKDEVDFETFSKSDFRAVKVKSVSQCRSQRNFYSLLWMMEQA